MKELLLEYARYNVWANKRIIDALLAMDEELLDSEQLSSFPTIRATVYHTWSAEFVWLQRLQLTENPAWVADFKGPFTEACREWLLVGETIINFISSQKDDNMLKHVVGYTDRQKNAHKTPVYQVLHHIFNHSTYHRGQLVTMLRQVGVTKVPGTDFIGWVRF